MCGTDTDEQLAAAIAPLCRRIDCAALLVTRGEGGMALFDCAGNHVSISARKVRVRDVSGAGDTVAATVACFLGLGASFEAAMRAANVAAGIAVGKRGTATVSAQELRAHLIPVAPRANEVKIVSSVEEMLARLEAWRHEGLRIGFTNGCFDILHPGHVRLLGQARAACDRLIVGLNTDSSVRRLKGPTRPLQNEMSRAEVLASLEATDMVVFFDEDTPLRLIEQINPSVLVKGSDYSKDQIVGASFVESNGGEVILVDLVPQQSTTRIVESVGVGKGAEAPAPR
jgi:D-beta-D-heptose 7-phosphate kinase/D-beta-D-heptose 1-phosphate adenosyltransferase